MRSKLTRLLGVLAMALVLGAGAVAVQDGPAAGRVLADTNGPAVVAR